MRLLTCGHCGRPFYDNKKACPYCGHAFLSLQDMEDETLETKQEDGQTAESHTEAQAEPQPTATNPSVNSRSESIAAITAANSRIAAGESHSESDPNQIETTYPPRHRRLWVWIVFLLLLGVLAAVAYILITNGSISFGAIGIK